MSKLYVGAVAPEAWGLDVTAGDSGVDLSTVTGATLYARKPDGTEMSYTASLANQTTTTLSVLHLLPAAPTPSEIDQDGAWRIYARLNVPGGSLRTGTVIMNVEREYF